LDYFRQQYLAGKVVDKYKLSNGNVGIIVQGRDTNKLYHVEFKDNYKSSGNYNLFGFLNERYSGKTEPLDKLINNGDMVELTVSYSKEPIRQAYKLHSLYPSSGYNYPQNVINLPYHSAKTY
jgi:hypothetical protein